LLGGNRLVWRRIERNEGFISALSTQLAVFWRHVEHRKPPPIDGSKATREALKRLYPHDTGEEIGLPLEADMWDRGLANANTDVAAATERRDEAANKIKAAIGTASIGVLPGGDRYTYREAHRKAYDVDATSFRVLRREKK
jgi:predicted phage-related endonuclease